MSIITEHTVGVSYDMSVYHIGVAFAPEDKNKSRYGYSFRVEYSHRSGAIHIKVIASGQGDFREWLETKPDILTTSLDFGRFGRKRRIITVALGKIEAAYCRYLLDKNQKGPS